MGVINKIKMIVNVIYILCKCIRRNDIILFGVDEYEYA